MFLYFLFVASSLILPFRYSLFLFLKCLLASHSDYPHLFHLDAVTNAVIIIMRCGSIVGMVTGYGLDDWGVRVGVPVGSRIFTSPHRPGRLWGPHCLLFNGYRGLFPAGKEGRMWCWPLNCQLVPSWRKCGSISTCGFSGCLHYINS
jgi:hypothetical protein